MSKKEVRKYSLLQIERELEPDSLRDKTCQMVEIISAVFENDTNEILKAMIEKDALKKRVLVGSLQSKEEQERNPPTKEKIARSIRAINELSQLLSGDHPIVGEMADFRKSLGYEENIRQDGVSIAEWSAAESEKTVKRLYEKFAALPSSKPSSAVVSSVTGEVQNQI